MLRMYRVKLHRDVEKFLRRIPKHDAERIRENILSLKDPFAAKPRKVKGERTLSAWEFETIESSFSSTKIKRSLPFPK